MIATDASSPAPEVTIVEVAPRDGLQNDPRNLTTQQKIDMIECLVGTGIRAIEPTSFVSPNAVPKMADATEIMTRVARDPAVRYICLVPNEKGLQRALAANVDSVAIFAAATDAFSRANLNCTVEESFDQFERVLHLSQQNDVWVRGYVSVAFHCPYSGAVATEDVLPLVERLHAIGCDEIDLADTIGIASPDEVAALIEQVAEVIPLDKVSLHVHDTHGVAIDNIEVAFDLGIRIFDGAAIGMGGCPFAPGAPGNVATEKIVDYFENRGVATGIDAGSIPACVPADDTNSAWA